MKKTYLEIYHLKLASSSLLAASEHGPPKPIAPIPVREGPLEAYGRDVAYYRSARQEAKALEEQKRLDELKSSTNQLLVMEKKEKAKAGSRSFSGTLERS